MTPRESRMVGGWLALLCVLLLLWHPTTFALRASRGVGALPVRGALLGVMLIVDLGVTACGAAAAVALWRRQPIGVGMAKVALIAGGIFDLLRYTTTLVPNSLMPGDAPFYVVVTLIYFGGWLLYLFRSRRVREILDL
jgi:hypothetical protein